MPPLPGSSRGGGGTRRSLLLDWMIELELEPWVSQWSNHFGEESTPPLTCTEGNKMPPPRRLEGGEQGVSERPNPWEAILPVYRIFLSGTETDV